MPEIDDVVAGEPVESSWGNLIRSRTLQRYTSEAERDFLNPTPQEGDLAYIQNIEEVQVFDGSEWLNFELGDNLNRRSKPVGQFATDTTATQVDDDLHFFAEAGERWALETWLAISGNNLIGFRARWGAPAGSTGTYAINPTPGNDQTDVVRDHGFNSLGFFSGPVSGNGKAVTMSGFVQVGGTGGEINLEWSADAAPEGSLTVEQGSYMIATRL